MFRRRKEKKAKKEAAKKAKAEQEAAGGVQLVRVAPKGTQYGGESPDYPLALRNPALSRSMDALTYDRRPPPITLTPLDTDTDGKKKKKKKSTLRRAQSLAEDGMLAQSPQQQRQRAHQPVYYYNDAALTPMYVLPDERGNGDAHPNTRPRYVLAYPQQHPLDPAYLRSPQHSLDPAYLRSPQHSVDPPLLRSGPAALAHYHPQPHTYQQQLSHNGTTSPTTPRSTGRSPSPGRAGRYRNVNIIPKTEQTSKSAQKQRPVSQMVYPASTPLRPNSTPLRSPSPMRSPSPAIYNTNPRKGKGKAIRVVEGWDEPDDEVPKVVQSHEVGVAPRSKVIDDFNSRSTSSPFSITISNDNKYSSSVSSSPPIQRREPTRKNKARPVSAAPWVAVGDVVEYQQKSEPIERQNGHMMVDFTE